MEVPWSSMEAMKPNRELNAPLGRRGGAMETPWSSMETRGGSIDLRGAFSEVNGVCMEVNGASTDVHGGCHGILQGGSMELMTVAVAMAWTVEAHLEAPLLHGASMELHGEECAARSRGWCAATC